MARERNRARVHAGSRHAVHWALVAGSLLLVGVGCERAPGSPRSVASEPTATPSSAPATAENADTIAPSEPSWDVTPCARHVATARTTACERARGPQRLFATGAGCASDLGEHLPCGDLLDPALTVASAASNASESTLRVDFVVSGFVEHEADDFLCACSGELRALDYRVHSESDVLRAASEVDRLEIARTPDLGLRYTWRSIGTPDALLRNQFAHATGAPTDSAVDGALDGVAERMQ